MAGILTRSCCRSISLLSVAPPLRCGASVAAIMSPRFQSQNASTQWVGKIEDQDFWTKNKKMNRPMSPHLTIYRPQLTSLLSITHRGSGIALTGAISIAAITLGCGSEPLSFYLDIAKDLPGPVLFGGKFLLTWPFVYHSANGLRHLMWDMGKGLSLEDVYKSGWLVFGISTVLATGIVML